MHDLSDQSFTISQKSTPSTSYNGPTENDLWKGKTYSITWNYSSGSSTFNTPAIKLRKDVGNNTFEDVLDIAAPGVLSSSDTSFDWTVPRDQNLDLGVFYEIYIYDANGPYNYTGKNNLRIRSPGHNGDYIKQNFEFYKGQIYNLKFEIPNTRYAAPAIKLQKKEGSGWQDVLEIASPEDVQLTNEFDNGGGRYEYNWTVPRNENLVTDSDHQYRFEIYDTAGEWDSITTYDGETDDTSFNNPGHIGDYIKQNFEFYKGQIYNLKFEIPNTRYAAPAIKLQKKEGSGWQDVLEIASPEDVQLTNEFDNGGGRYEYNWTVPRNENLVTDSDHQYRFEIYDTAGEWDSITTYDGETDDTSFNNPGHIGDYIKQNFEFYKGQIYNLKFEIPNTRYAAPAIKLQKKEGSGWQDVLEIASPEDVQLTNEFDNGGGRYEYNWTVPRNENLVTDSDHQYRFEIYDTAGEWDSITTYDGETDDTSFNNPGHIGDYIKQNFEFYKGQIYNLKFEIPNTRYAAPAIKLQKKEGSGWQDVLEIASPEDVQLTNEFDNGGGRYEYNWTVPRNENLVTDSDHQYRFEIYDTAGEWDSITTYDGETDDTSFNTPRLTDYKGHVGDWVKGQTYTLIWELYGGSTFDTPAIKLQKRDTNQVWQDILDIVSPGDLESADTSFDWTVPNNKELVINLGYPGNGACNSCYNYRFYHYDANGEYDEFTDSDVYKINFTGNEMPSTSSFSVSAASNTGKR